MGLPERSRAAQATEQPRNLVPRRCVALVLCGFGGEALQAVPQPKLRRCEAVLVAFVHEERQPLIGVGEQAVEEDFEPPGLVGNVVAPDLDEVELAAPHAFASGLDDSMTAVPSLFPRRAEGGSTSRTSCISSWK